MAGDMRKASKVSHDKRYDTMIQLGEDAYNSCLKFSQDLKTLEDKINFTNYCLVEAFKLTQKQGLFATAMTGFNKTKKIVEKRYGNRFNLEQLIYSLPGCITQELFDSK